MKITKFGHCCLLIEEKGVRVLTDPGTYTTTQNEIKNIDIVLITHEHADHFHIDSVKEILKNNPEALIVTNSSVNELLKKENILNVKVVEDGETDVINGLVLKGFGKLHAVIHTEWPIVQNTGYFVGERLFYPGDAFTNPNCQVDILALPLAGPWLSVKEAIDYCLEVKPIKVFAVHDGGLNEKGLGFSRRVAPQILEKHNIQFLNFEDNKEYEF